MIKNATEPCHNGALEAPTATVAIAGGEKRVREEAVARAEERLLGPLLVDRSRAATAKIGKPRKHGCH